MPRRKDWLGLPEGATIFDEVIAIAGQRVRERELQYQRLAQQGVEGHRRKRREAAARKTEEWHAKRKAEWRANHAPAPLGERIIDRTLLAMEPDQWYARADLCAEANLKDNEALYVTALRVGWLERRRNPEWRQRPKDRYVVEQPHWLYRLTEAGRARRELLLLLT